MSNPCFTPEANWHSTSWREAPANVPVAAL
jgi:hypothetical protein